MSAATPPDPSGSRPGSRPINTRLSPSVTRGSTSRTRSFIHQGPENLILSESQLGGEEAALLHDLVYPHEHTAEATLVDTDGPRDAEEDYQELDRLDLLKKPWYRRPSAWWLLCLIPVTSIAMSATIAPRVEMYTYLVCREHRGYKESNGPASMAWPMITNPHLSVEPVTPTLLGGAVRSVLNLNPIVKPTKLLQITYEDDDDNESQPCASDPEVQADVAKLIATMTSLMGVLSCITTTWWGSFSDRYGRLRLMGIAVFGLLYSDFNFIMVSNLSHKIRGGYWFLIVGPMVEGFFGGLPTAVASMHAYVADCTEASSRSRMFSLQVGFLFVGMAAGPTLGGLLIRLTHGVLSPLNNVLSVFYAATGIHVLYALMLWFIVPESLGERARAVCREERRREKEEAAAKERREAEEFARDGGDGSQWGAVVFKSLLRVKRISTFFSPLHVFLPVEVDTETQIAGERNLKIRPKKDWNLTIFAVGFGFYQMIMGSYQYKFQYAAGAFSWTSEQLGYFLSVVGAVRAVYLTVLLPLVIKLFQRRRPAIQLPAETDEPLSGPEVPVEGSSSAASVNGTDTLPKSPKVKAVPFNALKFDLNLARFSLLLEIICYSTIPLARGPIWFVVLSLLVSFGAGFGPAVQSVALDLFNTRRQKAGGATAGSENGRLFGSLSFLQALCAQIIGPALFGITYMETVKTYPGAIFFASAAVLFCTLICMCFIRLPKHNLAVAPKIVVEEVVVREDLEAGPVQRGRQPRLDRDVTLVDVSDL